MKKNPTLVVGNWEYKKVSAEFKCVENKIRNNIANCNKILGRDVFDEQSVRLPSNIFLEKEADLRQLYGCYDIEVKNRHIFDYNAKKSLSVNLFPIHAGIEVNGR